MMVGLVKFAMGFFSFLRFWRGKDGDNKDKDEYEYRYELISWLEWGGVSCTLV